MGKKIRKLSIVCVLFLLLCTQFVACGGKSGGDTPSQKTDTPVSTEKGTRDNTPIVLVPEASGVTTETCDIATIDLSNTAEGYFMVEYTGTVQKVKLQVSGPDEITYTYNLHGSYEVFPLTAGNGTYTIGIYENISGTSYSTALSCTTEVSITNEFGPYLYPNQYVNFNADSLPIDKAVDLAYSANTDLEVVENVYNYIIDNFTYDYDKASIRHAVTYPLIMTVMMLVVIVVIITQVVPVFSQIYEQLGSGLSGTALLLMNISNVLNNYMLYFVLGVVIIALAAFLFSRTSFGKIMFQGRSLSMTIAASRFANCMYLALSSGLDTDRSLEMAEKLIDNPYMLERIKKCKEHIKHGESFIKSLLLSGIFSKMYSSMMTIGYKTGSMDDIMHKISVAYEEESDAKLRHFISILEPTLIIILSFFIGLILISFLLPLLGIISSIG